MNKKVDDGTIDIHGKTYETVALRVKTFRYTHPEWTIKTVIVATDADRVLVEARILDDNGRMIANGHAEETRSRTGVNSTSALENAETSAVGRALALYGLPGSTIRSADEMSDAVQQQKVDKIINWLKAHNQAVRENLDVIVAVKNGLIADVTKEPNYRDLDSAAEEYFSMSEETQNRLWVATTKGGIWTTREREILQSSEFAKAHFGEVAGEAHAEAQVES